MDYKAFLLKYGIDATIALYKKLMGYIADKKESKEKLEAFKESLKDEAKSESEQREDHKSFIK